MIKTDIISRLGFITRTKRSQMGLSQEEFAAKIGLHRTYVGSVERGERNLTIKSLVAIATGLGVTVSRLIEEAEKLEIS
ncbi:helix-turn-helix domain-containing protein [Acidobacteriota bacterium]